MPYANWFPAATMEGSRRGHREMFRRFQRPREVCYCGLGGIKGLRLLAGAL